jgi:hypothetical protein
VPFELAKTRSVAPEADKLPQRAPGTLTPADRIGEMELGSPNSKALSKSQPSKPTFFVTDGLNVELPLRARRPRGGRARGVSASPARIRS